MSNLSALDLAALLCSRVCHDVVGSVGAISNGLEVLDEEKDAEMREIAGTLVRKSAAQASAKLPARKSTSMMPVKRRNCC